VGNLAWSVGNVRITRVVEREVPVGLTELLPEATREALAPHRAWLEPHFLNADGTVRWSDVYLVGYSYGSQTLAVVGKYVRIGRGIATSGPVDEGFPNATWIKAPSATPLERMIALIGSSNIDSKVTTTTSAGWLVPTVTVNVGAATAALMNGHVFILEGQGHSEMCAGDGGNWKALCQYAFGVAQ